MSYVATNKFRWHVVRNKITREMVEEYRTEHGTTMMESARVLRNETPMVLQQWFEMFEGWGAGEWRDIPIEVTEHEVVL